MLLTMLCTFFSILSPYTFGSYSSCVLLGSTPYHCPYIDDIFPSVVTLIMGRMGMSPK